MVEIVKFEQWAVVEIMGHRKFAGFVSEQSIGGSSFVRVDIPESETRGEKLPAFTKLFGSGSIYCISPCTEETARAFASQIRSRAFELYEAPRLELISTNTSSDDDTWEPGCDNDYDECPPI